MPSPTDTGLAAASVAATIVRGHRVASGGCADPRFPHGTIAPQLPLFRERVPDFDAWLDGSVFPGTINLRVAGHVAIDRPELVLRDIRWSMAVPAETFHLSRGGLVIDGAHHPAWLYLPDPATKPDHHQPTGTIELLAAHLPGAAYGVGVTLLYRPEAIVIRPAG